MPGDARWQHLDAMECIFLTNSNCHAIVDIDIDIVIVIVIVVVVVMCNRIATLSHYNLTVVTLTRASFAVAAVVVVRAFDRTTRSRA